MRKNSLVAPILKWVGGKRQLLPEIEKYIPEFSTYYEPFVGGGAVLFNIQPQKAVVNDINKELINLYSIVKNNVEELIEDLKKHQNDETYFYSQRELDRNRKKYKNMTDIERASRVVFLNKTCYNGLFRVNRSGEFNAPFGNYKNPNIVNEGVLRAVSKYFNRANIVFRCCDFEKALKDAKKGAFVYLDPPYFPVSSSSNFTGYDKCGFDRYEHERLKKICDSLNERGIKFLLSNSSSDSIKELFKDYKIEIVQAKRAINSKADKRGEIDEILVRNYE